ncbi:MAG: hypothetical protein J6L89_06255 [Clostridia bacterium]|nr:hypothetical protein [Clostridia bacterium]
MKKITLILIAATLLCISLCSCNTDKTETDTTADATVETITHKVVEDSYSSDGKYYCMGKNDTCPKKTNDQYDFFCYACDPDGDNVEG